MAYFEPPSRAIRVNRLRRKQEELVDQPYQEPAAMRGLPRWFFERDLKDEMYPNRRHHFAIRFRGPEFTQTLGYHDDPVLVEYLVGCLNDYQKGHPRAPHHQAGNDVADRDRSLPAVGL